MRTSLKILAAAMGLAGGSMMAIETSASAQGRMAPARASLAYVAKAGAGDLYEIQSSQLAARRARRPGVRAFAQMLATDHRRSTREIVAAARASGLRPSPPRLDPAQRRMLRELERAPAARFDAIYLRQQIPAHQQALALHRDHARTGDRPRLRRVAARIVPVVEAHLAQARRLAR